MSATTPLGIRYPTSGDSFDVAADMKRVAEDADALSQAGAVCKTFISNGSFTRASTEMGSLSTPIKVTFPKVKAGQLLEMWWLAGIKGSVVESTSIGAINVSLNGTKVGSGAFIAEANKQMLTYSIASGSALQGSVGEPTELPVGGLWAHEGPADWAKSLIGADATNYTLEIVVKGVTGSTVTIKRPVLIARLLG